MFDVSPGAAEELKKKLVEVESPDAPLRLVYRGFG